ncbi:MAG: phosphoglycerate kinase [Alphaproteobacteria bacterium]|nr:phosphoglycerate kinase [Alphaproteobacteria bacterium SS10]
MPDFKTLDDLLNDDVSGKTVLVRGDLNVPMQDGLITDTTRLERLAPTLTRLSEAGAKVVVLSHFGRPKGAADLKFSLRPVAKGLAEWVGGDVAFGPDCVGPDAENAIADLPAGGILVLENLRFYPGETDNDDGFADRLAALGDIYVNDAFSAAHRAHASTTALAKRLPAYAGLLMAAELSALGQALEQPERPVVALVGGAKVSTKLDLLQNLVTKVDVLVLGGGMANTFIAAEGGSIGKSLFEPDKLDAARAVQTAADQAGCRILLPRDGVIAAALAPDQETAVVPSDQVPEGQMILDIGPDSIADIDAALRAAKTVVWNGPMGAFETVPFDQATVAVGKTVAELTNSGAILSVAGGGDTVAALAHAGIEDDISYVSAAGGAFLEWLEGKELPGVAALAA